MLIKGFTIKRAGEDYQLGKNETMLGLLAESHGVEIMLQNICANDLVMLTPSEDKGLCEYAFIVDGALTLECGDETISLNKNDFFACSDFEDTVLMKCSAPVTLLYITSKPTFNHVKMYVSNLDELINRIDEKDKYTKSHCQHVMDYSIAISRVMQCSSSITERLAISALFHDVGKVDIPDEVLNKPGKLDSEERKYIYKHPICSKELVEENFGPEIANIVLCHHERQNGTGYPQGISSDDIPLEARIIAVADSFDAMTTKRPYNTTKTFEQAVDELLKMTDEYDMNAVNALKTLVDSREIYDICDAPMNF